MDAISSPLEECVLRCVLRDTNKIGSLEQGELVLENVPIVGRYETMLIMENILKCKTGVLVTKNFLIESTMTNKKPHREWIKGQIKDVITKFGGANIREDGMYIAGIETRVVVFYAKIALSFYRECIYIRFRCACEGRRLKGCLESFSVLALIDLIFIAIVKGWYNDETIFVQSTPSI